MSLHTAEVAGSNPAEPIVLLRIGHTGAVHGGFLACEDYGEKKHNEDKKLHNSEEELHNSNRPDLNWQESIDLLPKDKVEGGPEIYYSVDEDGKIHWREFLAEELIPDENGMKDSFKTNSSAKLETLKPGAIDVISPPSTK
jgi:hypothetical protein